MSGSIQMGYRFDPKMAIWKPRSSNATPSLLIIFSYSRNFIWSQIPVNDLEWETQGFRLLHLMFCYMFGVAFEVLVWPVTTLFSKMIIFAHFLTRFLNVYRWGDIDTLRYDDTFGLVTRGWPRLLVWPLLIVFKSFFGDLELTSKNKLS